MERIVSIAIPRQARAPVVIRAGSKQRAWSFEEGIAPVIGAPFSATKTVQSSMTYRDGNRRIQGITTRRIYRDSQGRTRTDDLFISADSPDGPVPTGTTINDPVAWKRYWLHPKQKTFNEMLWHGPSAITAPVVPPVPSTDMSVEIGYFQEAPESECKTVSLGEQVMDGIKVIGTRVECTIPIGTLTNQKPIDIRVEQWFSPDLGVIMQTTHWSSIGTEGIHKLEQVVRAEPDPTLFTLPADYTDQITAVLAAQGRALPPKVNPAYYSGPVDPSRLPETGAALVVRTAFSDQAAWEAIRDEIQQSGPRIEGYSCVTFVDDRTYEGFSKDQLVAAIPEKYSYSFMFIVDATTVTTKDHPVLVVNLRKRPGAEFRAVTSEIYTIEANLSLANLDFDDFARAAAETGVYRGFPKSPPSQQSSPAAPRRHAELRIWPPIGGQMSSLGAGNAAVVGVPYSGTRTSTLANGDQIVRGSVTRFFRDSSGRTRLERRFPADASVSSPMVTALVTINDPVSGKKYTLEPQEKTGHVFALSDSDARLIQPPVTPPPASRLPRTGPGLPGVTESKPASLGEKSIDGIHVVGTRIEYTMTFEDREAQTMTCDQWFSPELGLMILSTQRTPDGVSATERLEDIVQAEPDSALFCVPPEYTLSG
ncbi:MAG TPA: hypothetical protein VI653_02695 [Steroidobacteraceae bacterium]